MRGVQTIGAVPLGQGRCSFRVWAPYAKRVDLVLYEEPERRLRMARDARGYHSLVAEGVEPATRYVYSLNGTLERADPASRYQPQGVHGPSCVFEPRYSWTDRGWHGLPLEDYVIYELHVGTFTADGTFEAVIPHLDTLRELGVTAIELMPIAQFPGSRNWGYDGVFPYAAQDSYGGPQGLQALVDACHRRGMAVVLDVVYNHLGPEGNHLSDFGPYFTARYKTPWGQAINYDDAQSDEVRRYFIENALYWVTDCHVDALRLDAVHAILDTSATHILEELAVRVRERAVQLNRQIHLIAESDLNDPRLVRSRELGGYGLDAQWSDDFHHAVHSLVTGEESGYYADYGRVAHLASAYRDAFVYAGVRSGYRQRTHGRSAAGLEGKRFVVCAQNHDQVGNRMLGERLSRLASFEELKLAAAAVILSPYLPLLFMGEEYGETNPFPYFISHSDPGLIEAVRTGRRNEFAAFRWAGEPPDPQSLATFESAILDHGKRAHGQHRQLWDFYRELLRLRKSIPALRVLDRDAVQVTVSELSDGLPLEAGALAPPRIGEAHQDPALYDARKGLMVRRTRGDDEVALLFHFGDTTSGFADPLPLPSGVWTRLLESADDRWGGGGARVPKALDSNGRVELTLAPHAAVVLRRER